MAEKETPATWPSPSIWRRELALALHEAFECRTYHSMFGSFTPPCIVVLPSLINDWFEDVRSEGGQTFCTHKINFDVLLVGGKNNDEASLIQIEDWTVGLAKALEGVHEREALAAYVGAPVRLGSISGPGNIELGNQHLLASVARVEVETHIQ